MTRQHIIVSSVFRFEALSVLHHASQASLHKADINLVAKLHVHTFSRCGLRRHKMCLYKVCRIFGY